MSFAEGLSWHPGEERMHRLTRVPRLDNPSSPFLTPRAANQIQRFPLMAVGTLDSEARPWATLWGGETPLAQPVAQSIIGIRTTVDASYDPVITKIFDGRHDGEVIKDGGKKGGRMISGLSINLEERNRVKLYGRMVAGALNVDDKDHDGGDRGERTESAVSETQPKEAKRSQHGRIGQVQLVVHIEQSLQNCPKYINSKRIIPTTPHPKLISDSPVLPPQALTLLEKADMFFVASSDADQDMDMNHRGGPKGFIRVASNTPSVRTGTDPDQTTADQDEKGAVLVWPEYSGNNLYQTLGNLLSTPRAGMVIPDYTTGDVLYLTGTTEVLVGKDAHQLLPHSTLAVRLRVTAARFVETGLPFRGIDVADTNLGGGASPYNPRIRYLRSEKKDGFAEDDDREVKAKLVMKEKLTPSIHRYRFALSDPVALKPWRPGQYVAMSFREEMDMGYSHMRDEDPGSLNDDFLRTFTVSSRFGLGRRGEEFEIMVRDVGSVTGWLGRQRMRRGVEVEVGIRGFEGEFRVRQEEGKRVGFVAAGIGITPLLSQVEDLHLERLRLFWSVGVRDVGLVKDVWEKYPKLVERTEGFLTGDIGLLDQEGKKMVELVKRSGARVEMRRLLRKDLEREEVDEWYLCAAPALRKQVQEWLPGRQVMYESFDY